MTVAPAPQPALASGEAETLTLRPYQEEDVRFLLERRRGAIWHEPGTGKTAIAIAAVQRAGARRVLIVAPKVTHGVWETEFSRWDPEREVITATGTPPQREKAHQALKDTATASSTRGRALACILNFHLLHEVVEHPWDAIVFDEAHQAVASRGTRTFLDARRITRAAEYVFLLTGTPVRKGPHDLWAYLHLIEPQRFGSYWAFVDRWCEVVHTPFGAEIQGAKNPRELSRFLREFARRRLKREVMPDLPAKVRRAVTVDLEGEQWDLYHQLANSMIASWMTSSDGAGSTGGADADEDDGAEGTTRHLIVTNRLAQATRLRQLLVHPALIGARNIDSVGMTAACDLAEQYATGSEGRAAVIFTPFAAAIPLLDQKLRERSLLTYVLHGGTSQRDRVQNVEQFRTGRSPAVLIATSSLGLGWSATRASNAIFLGFEWDRVMMEQCEDRLHRHGQRSSVNLEYIVHRNSIDRRVLRVLDGKERYSREILNDPRGLLLNHLP